MPSIVVSIFLDVLLAGVAFAQVSLGQPGAQISLGRPSPESQTPASPGWPFGRPNTRVALEGLLACSDGDTLSIELTDQRVIRFRLEGKTRYFPDGHPGNLGSFHMTDFVHVESEVAGKGYLIAHSVRFLRKATSKEQAEIFQNPELTQRWRANLLASSNLDTATDDRRLSLVSKPESIRDDREDTGTNAKPLEPLVDKARPAPGLSDGSRDYLIQVIRRSVNEAFENLPNFRAKQVTSMFKSFSKPVKWIPDGMVTAEISYEEDHESYADLRVDGKEPKDAPALADADYVRSLDKAWSTGDFETISHCIFSELADSDFHQTRIEQSNGARFVNYEFYGRRSSACVGVTFKSQVTYPAYKGSLKVRAQTGEIVHVELEATEIPGAFPLDRAERSVDFATVRIGSTDYLLPATAYWFGCFRNSYSCFLNRIDFRDYRRFEADSTVSYDK